jgi:hypothetical protein
MELIARLLALALLTAGSALVLRHVMLADGPTLHAVPTRKRRAARRAPAREAQPISRAA